VAAARRLRFRGAVLHAVVGQPGAGGSGLQQAVAVVGAGLEAGRLLADRVALHVGEQPARRALVVARAPAEFTHAVVVAKMVVGVAVAGAIERSDRAAVRVLAAAQGTVADRVAVPVSIPVSVAVAVSIPVSVSVSAGIAIAGGV